jgi:autotransporter family porin
VSNVTPGLWVKGVGAYIQRDRDEDNDVVTDRDQRVYGLMAGFDFGTENLGEQGDALMFGLSGGYIHSDLEFDATNTEWKFEGPSVGV